VKNRSEERNMQNSEAILLHVSHILSYPDEHNLQHVDLLRSELPAGEPEARMFEPFRTFVQEVPLTTVEELFTSTFEMNASRCLEVGWHLYGEEYQRGQFLVKMRQALAEENLPESVELPDHMSHCLQLLVRLEPEDAEVFARRYLQPAITKILQDFDAANPYKGVIELLQATLVQRYGAAEANADSARLKVLPNDELPILNNCSC